MASSWLHLLKSWSLLKTRGGSVRPHPFGSLADGSPRPWHGYETQTRHLGADGGHARYQLVLEPWLAFLGERTDCYLFQDLDVLEALTRVFADHLVKRPQARWHHEVTQPLRKHSRLTQYRESDLDFTLRPLAEEGLSFRFEHSNADDSQFRVMAVEQRGVNNLSSNAASLSSLAGGGLRVAPSQRQPPG